MPRRSDASYALGREDTRFGCLGNPGTVIPTEEGSKHRMIAADADCSWACGFRARFTAAFDSSCRRNDAIPYFDFVSMNSRCLPSGLPRKRPMSTIKTLTTSAMTSTMPNADTRFWT